MYRNRLILLLLLAAVVCPQLVFALADPTKPSSYAVSKQSRQSLKLESILYSQTRKVAVINGNIVAEGEKIGSKKIIYIGKNSVQLRSGEKTLTLRLDRKVIRQEK